MARVPESTETTYPGWSPLLPGAGEASVIAELHKRISFRRDITALTGGGEGKLDGIVTAGGALPVNAVIRVSVPEGIIDFALIENEEGFITADSLPNFILPDDAHPETNNVVWVNAGVSILASLNLYPLKDSTLGGFLSLWNSAHTGSVQIHAKNCDAGVDGVEFTKAGIVAMLSDLLTCVRADGSVLNTPSDHTAGARHSLGITRIVPDDFVQLSNCDIAVSGITGGSAPDPNAAWLPNKFWRNDRPTWRLTGQDNGGWDIFRNGTGYWEIRIDDTLALRSTTQWLEFPWQEEGSWTNHNGYAGPPLLEPYDGQQREFIPPDMLPPERVYPLNDGAIITPNFAAAKIFTVTLGGNRTLANPINAAAGMYIVRVTQDGTGGRTLAFGNAYRFPGGIVPGLSSAAGARDVLTIFTTGDGTFDVLLSADFRAPA